MGHLPRCPFTTLLLVEDSPTTALLIQEYLTRLYRRPPQCLHAETVDVALAILRTQLVDVILTDLLVPPSTGTETLQALITAAPLVPLVAYSARLDPTEREALMLLGAQGAIEKDFTPESLTVLRAALESAWYQGQAMQHRLRVLQQ